VTGAPSRLENAVPLRLLKARVERNIAMVRVAIAASSLLAVWLDPLEPARYVQLTYGLHVIYLGYALVLAAVMWRRPSGGRLPLVTHVFDIVAASLFQYLTLGPSSPFFIYFVFSLFCAAIRWGWRETVLTATVELLTFIAMSLSMMRAADPSAFELNRFIIRAVYLIVVTVLLGYLVQHEARLREHIRGLARWPDVLPAGADHGLAQVLAHAAGLVGATRVLVLWSVGDEPWVFAALCPAPSAFAITKHAPDEFEPLVPDALEGTRFICGDSSAPRPVVKVARPSGVQPWIGHPMHAGLRRFLDDGPLASTVFRTDRADGRLFFTMAAPPPEDVLPLIDVIGREIGLSIDRMLSYEQSRHVAAAEARIRVARDLHDGVLQSLTGVRLELQSLGTTPASDEAPVRDRLFAIERALALEQRELRSFIEDLKPRPEALRGGFAERLDGLRRQLESHWKAPITLRVTPPDLGVPSSLERDVTFLIREAVVNALKHAGPSRVSVDVQPVDHQLVIAVADDGRGFGFTGVYDHAALAAGNVGPVSLRERAASLGGTLTLASSERGARIDLRIPLEPAHV
jgi:signal transduction histidine kinase